jgi:adenosine deaminase
MLFLIFVDIPFLAYNTEGVYLIMSILIASLGCTIDTIIEVLGFINLDSLGFYNKHQNIDTIKQTHKDYFQNKSITEIWLYSTHQNEVIAYKEKLDLFCHNNNQPIITRLFILPFADIDTKKHADIAKELALRLLYMAKATNKTIFISLTGGRKTMSSDLYSAGSIFGCDGFIHILSNTDPKSKITFYDKTTDLITESEITYFNPLFYGQTIGNPAIRTIKPNQQNYSLPLPDENGIKYIDEHELGSCSLQKHIDSLLEKAAYLLVNSSDTKLFYNFPILQTCSSELLHKLALTKITHIDQIKGLPKIDLHCHLGGCLAISDIVTIAEEVRKHELKNIKPISLQDATECIKKAKEDTGYFKKLDYPTKIQILSSFKNDTKLLEDLWYSVYIEEKNFFIIDFNLYEQLGDIQGSSLLQTRIAIRLAVQNLIHKSKEDNCIGLEIRCSPQNYTKEGLSYNQVLFEILDEINQSRGELEVSLILIASRHRKMSEIYATIELYSEINKDAQLQNLFQKYFKGFDVAGAEQVRRPSEIRNAFIDILKACHPITIHAGETESAENIWEAVYELNADRIGHGLSLHQNKALLVKFREKAIGIELCPSSNFQIVGFNDYYLNITDKENYPLHEYLQGGLKVTVNTDNRGISRTSLSGEFVKASRMTDGGLSLLEALQLCKNSIDVSFFDHTTKERLYQKAHEQIQHWLEATTAKPPQK